MLYGTENRVALHACYQKDTITCI